jgi:hypothetical protein
VDLCFKQFHAQNILKIKNNYVYSLQYKLASTYIVVAVVHVRGVRLRPELRSPAGLLFIPQVMSMDS